MGISNLGVGVACDHIIKKNIDATQNIERKV
jgi:hypothetical protein